MYDRKRLALAMLAVLAMALTGMAAMPLAAAQTKQQAPTSGCGLLPQNVQQQISSEEPWYCPINQQISQQWQSSLPLAFAALVLSYAIAGAIVMVGIAFRSDRIRNFGLGEMFEAIATTLIVVAFLYICAVAFGLLPGLVAGGSNPYATSFHLISTTIGTSQQLYASIYNVYYFFDYVISINAEINVLIPILNEKATFGIGEGSQTGNPNSQNAGETLGPLSGSQITALYTAPISFLILDPARALGVFLVDSMLALSAEYYALAFFASAAIPGFLIPGIVLRAIFPTRALGGFMIALGISFYLVAPTMFAIAYYFTTPTLQSSMQQSINQINQFSTGQNIQPSSISPTNPLVTSLSTAQSSISAFWLLALFFPALIIAIVYAFTTQLSRFIGGASRTGSRLRGFI